MMFFKKIIIRRKDGTFLLNKSHTLYSYGRFLLQEGEKKRLWSSRRNEANSRWNAVCFFFHSVCVCVLCIIGYEKKENFLSFQVERTQEIVSRKRWTETYNSFSAPIWCIEREKNQIYRKRFILVAKEKTGHTSRKSREVTSRRWKVNHHFSLNVSRLVHALKFLCRIGNVMNGSSK